VVGQNNAWICSELYQPCMEAVLDALRCEVPEIWRLVMNEMNEMNEMNREALREAWEEAWEEALREAWEEAWEEAREEARNVGD